MSAGKHREKGAAYTWSETPTIPKHRVRVSETWIIANDVLLDPTCTIWVSEYSRRQRLMRGAA